MYYKTNLKNKKTITFEEYLHTDKKPWHILNTNNNGNVIFRGKTVLSESNKEKPLNNDTAYAIIEMLILFEAQGIKPKKV